MKERWNITAGMRPMKGAMMKSGARIHKLSAGCRMPLLAAFVVLALAGCGRDRGDPLPPNSPPRPVTDFGGHIITSQLDLLARPVVPPPGEM